MEIEKQTLQDKLFYLFSYAKDISSEDMPEYIKNIAKPQIDEIYKEKYGNLVHNQDRYPSNND